MRTCSGHPWTRICDVEGTSRLGGIPADHELAADHVFDRCRVPADRQAVLVEDAALVSEQLDVVHGEPHLPDVGVAGHDPQALLLAGRSDDERDPRGDGLRRVARPAEAVSGRLVIHGLAVEQRSNDRQRLVEPVEPLADASPGSIPWAVTSSSRLPAPSPKTRRPPLM